MNRTSLTTTALCAALLLAPAVSQAQLPRDPGRTSPGRRPNHGDERQTAHAV